MTNQNHIQILRTVAKRLARAARIPHHQALDIVAARCGHPHWNALATACNKGWLPTTELLETLREPKTGQVASRGVGIVKEIEGMIAGEPYQLEIGFDDVLIGGRGWAIHLGHAPSEPAVIEKYAKPNPLDDEAFLTEIMKIANQAADGVREAIARDWPRRSTKPDQDGRAMHPLFGGLSAQWYCFHCDASATGEQMAANMWHCPKCHATPLDMRPSG